MPKRRIICKFQKNVSSEIQNKKQYNDYLNNSSIRADTPYTSSLDVKRPLISRSPNQKKSLGPEESQSEKLLKPYKPDLTQRTQDINQALECQIDFYIKNEENQEVMEGKFSQDKLKMLMNINAEKKLFE